jgi:plastocyanin
MALSGSRRTMVAGLGLAGILALSFAGCGGGKTDTSDAVVIPEKGANLSAAPATGAAAPTPTTAANAPTAAAPSTPVKAEGWGTLKGQVVFGGNPPAQEVLYDKGKAPKDETVCAKEEPIKVERLIVDGATKGVRNVIVYIPRPTVVNDEAKSAAHSAKVEFDQKNCVFKPHVLAVMVGATIGLRSSDTVNHNINAKLKTNTPFNSILNPGQTKDFVPTSGERSPSEVGCDIHPWMKAYWLILDSPYFAVTDDQGNFEIKHVPAGTQKVVVWHEAVSKGGFVTPPSGEGITIKADDTASKTFTIDAGKILPGK